MIKNCLISLLSIFILQHFSLAKGNEGQPLLPKKETEDKRNPELWEKLRKDNPEAIGAIAESSKDLARAITTHIPSLKFSSRRILEVGAGTGVFTRELVTKLGPNDHLDVVELTEDLCKLLRDEFGNHKSVTIFCGDILKWQPGENSYDYIVSGLPFNSFPVDLVQQITDQFIRLAKPDGYVSFFEYLYLPHIRPILMSKKEKEDYEATRKVILNFVNKYKTSERDVYLNLPPAKVYYLQMPK